LILSRFRGNGRGFLPWMLVLQRRRPYGLLSIRKPKFWHVYSEYYQSHGDPAAHAQGIRSRGKWIPGLLDPMANGRSQSDGFNLLRMYQELELDLDPVADSEQRGVCEVLQRIRSGRLKVFRSLESGVPSLPEGPTGECRKAE
jgi:hypothetical protein